MSRLDLFIDRMVSQRACLDAAIAQTAAMTGPVFELGLGNGRTFHHFGNGLKDATSMCSNAPWPRTPIRCRPKTG